MVAQLETFHVGGGTSNIPISHGDEASAGDGLVQYQVTLKPGHIQLEKTSRLTELEQRIAKMESLIGATPPKLVSYIVYRIIVKLLLNSVKLMKVGNYYNQTIK